MCRSLHVKSKGGLPIVGDRDSLVPDSLVNEAGHSTVAPEPRVPAQQQSANATLPVDGAGVCKFFQNGRCRYGDSCAQSHTMGKTADGADTALDARDDAGRMLERNPRAGRLPRKRARTQLKVFEE